MPQTIKVKVNAGVKSEGVAEVTPGVFKIKTTTPPEHGKANERVITLLAKYLKVPKSRISLVRGKTSHNKTFLISYP